ncbi:MAG: YceI family protein [Limisphaerales bacterium]
MKIRTLIAGNIALLMLATAALQAADQTITYIGRPGSKMRIEGTANIIHPTWQIESPIIGGLLEVGPGFPTEPGQAATPGKIEASGKAFISVRSLKSVEADGTHYSDRMDEVTYEHLKEEQFKRIDYKLTELTLKEAPKTKDAPYVFDSTGDLTVAGVTKTIKMPVNILPVLDPKEKKLEITGNITVKMTDFKVDPVDINLVVGHIKTGDEVKLVFKWILWQKKAPAAAAK